MPRDRDLDNAPSSGQSKRPPLNHRDSDSHSDTTNNPAAPSHHHRTKHLRGNHHPARLHSRVPSAKAVHKTHGHAVTSHASSSKLYRRPSSPGFDDTSERPPHRRATSEVKLPRHSSAAHLPKSLSHTSLKRNRSHVEVAKRARSSDKLKQASNGNANGNANGNSLHRKSTKSQVHFDLGIDEPEDEWVDASGSNSPYLSRKGSLNSSVPSSLRQGLSLDSSLSAAPIAGSASQVPPSLDRETAQHKEYLTSRLLQRTPSNVAPVQMTADMAKAAPAHPARSVSSSDQHMLTAPGSNQDELVSRFVDTPGSGLTSQGSFYHPHPQSTSQTSDDLPARPSSMVHLDQSHKQVELQPVTPTDIDTSALVPKTGGRTSAPPAETSRTQQKLNLQRASSVLEPGQGLSGAGGVVGSSPLIGVGGTGFDGGTSRDPRIGKLLERTRMEYLVVRRYQNPVARSLNRISCLSGTDKTRGIPRTDQGMANGKKGTGAGAADARARRVRNGGVPEQRSSTVRSSGSSIKTNGRGSSLEGDDVSRLSERLSGASLVGIDEIDETQALLRSMWEKPLDHSANSD